MQSCSVGEGVAHVPIVGLVGADGTTFRQDGLVFMDGKAILDHLIVCGGDVDRELRYVERRLVLVHRRRICAKIRDSDRGDGADDSNDEHFHVAEAEVDEFGLHGDLWVNVDAHQLSTRWLP